MKKYKLIKEFPGSPKLGTIEEPVGKIHQMSNGNYGYNIDKSPEHWEEVVEMPRYMRCVRVWNGRTASEVNQIYDTSIEPNFSNLTWEHLLAVSNLFFVPATQEEWDKQEFDKIVQECIKRFPKGSKVKCAQDGKIYTIRDSFVYYTGRNSVLAVSTNIRTTTVGYFLYFRGKYAELVEENKDYEILTYEIHMDGYTWPVSKIPNGSWDNWSEAHKNQEVEAGRWAIHSVKRLSDGEIFTVGDNIAGQVLSGKITDIILEKDRIYFYVSSSRRLQLGNFIKKVKQPLFTTEDGVDIFHGMYYYHVSGNFNITERTANLEIE